MPAQERDPLERLGNAVWIAVLTVVASLGVVTTLAAFAAGLRAMSGVGDASRAPATEFWATLRASWRRSLPLVALWLAVGAVAAVDLVAAAALPEPLPAVVTTTGLVLVFALIQLWPYLAMELAARPVSGPEPGAGAGAVLKGAVARAGRRPGLAAAIGLLGLVVVVAMIAVPALAPVVMAAYLAAGTGVLVRTTNDDRVASTAQRPLPSTRSPHASRIS